MKDFSAGFAAEAFSPRLERRVQFFDHATFAQWICRRCLALGFHSVVRRPYGCMTFSRIGPQSLLAVIRTAGKGPWSQGQIFFASRVARPDGTLSLRKSLKAKRHTG